jgi:rhodanese-related sulfurtransferase
MAANPVEAERIAPYGEPLRLPRPLPEPGMFEVDATWGTIQPIEVAPGVRTVGELEVIEHARSGRPIVDTRVPPSHARAAIPDSISIPQREIIGRIDELRADVPTVFFCNGPQCAATPAAIRALLAAGQPAELILYYRGGMHDWITLGLPVTRSGASDQDVRSERPFIAAG